MSDNYLNKIFNSKINLKGELEKQQEAYREFISGSWKISENGAAGNIITFKPYYSGIRTENQDKNFPVKMAADSGTVPNVKRDTHFYVSENDDFALIIDEKTIADDTSLTASVISESGKEISESILYCPETNKYFLNNPDNEIILAGFKNFNFQSFSFKLIFPKSKIFFTIKEDPDESSALSSNLNIIVTKLKEKEGNIIVELEFSEDINILVLKSTKYKDFVSLNNCEILIPKALIESKFELLIY